MIDLHKIFRKDNMKILKEKDNCKNAAAAETEKVVLLTEIILLTT